MIPLRNIVDSRLFLIIRRAPCGASREMKLISPVMLMIPDVASVAIGENQKPEMLCVNTEHTPFVIVQGKHHNLPVQQKSALTQRIQRITFPLME